jgi:hypothetical protein
MIATMAGQSKSFEHPDEVFENPGVVQHAVDGRRSHRCSLNGDARLAVVRSHAPDRRW